MAQRGIAVWRLAKIAVWRIVDFVIIIFHFGRGA
jgi:hypothetical protein